MTRMRESKKLAKEMKKREDIFVTGKFLKKKDNKDQETRMIGF